MHVDLSVDYKCVCAVLESTTVEQLGVMAGCSQQHVPQTGLSRELQSSCQTLHQISIVAELFFALKRKILQHCGSTYKYI